MSIIPSASSFVDRPEASFFIVEDSVGYQIDYYPPLLTDNLQGAICATYADSGNWTALQICIKQSGNDLLAGLSYCSSNGSIPECLANQTQWTDNYNSILKVTISQRLSSVVYSRKNESILYLFDVGPPQPTNYGPNDFFPIFEMAMTNVTGDTLGYDYLDWVAGQGSSSSPYTNDFVLMDLLAIPVGRFNDATTLGIYPAENGNSTGALAVPSYRVYLHWISKSNLVYHFSALII
jgi:hypothetical protein